MSLPLKICNHLIAAYNVANNYQTVNPLIPLYQSIIAVNFNAKRSHFCPIVFFFTFKYSSELLVGIPYLY